MSVLRKLGAEVLWSGARVGECHVILQEMVNMCVAVGLWLPSTFLFEVNRIGLLFATLQTKPLSRMVFYFCQARHGLSNLRRRMV